MSKRYKLKYQNLVKKLRQARPVQSWKYALVVFSIVFPPQPASILPLGELGVDAVELTEFAKVYGKDINYFVK